MYLLYFWFLYNKSSLIFITRKLHFERFPCGSSGNFLLSKDSLFIICTEVGEVKQSYSDQGMQSCNHIAKKFECLIVELHSLIYLQSMTSLKFKYPLADIHLQKGCSLL